MKSFLKENQILVFVAIFCTLLIIIDKCNIIVPIYNLFLNHHIEIVNLLLWMIATIGFCHIVVDPSTIFIKISEWMKANTIFGSLFDDDNRLNHYVFKCHQCFGFWAGLVSSIFLVSFNPVIILACGFGGSFLCMFSSWTLEYITSNISIGGNND